MVTPDLLGMVPIIYIVGQIWGIFATFGTLDLVNDSQFLSLLVSISISFK